MSQTCKPECFLDVRYDGDTKTWKSENYPYGTATNRSVGEAFLESMRSVDPEKVLEYHYDVAEEKRARDIYRESMTVAMNLQRLGIGRGDVVVLFSGYNYWISVLTFGSLLAGAAVNFFEVQLENEDIDSIMNILQPAVILYEHIYQDKILNSLKRRRPRALKCMYSVNHSDQGCELLKLQLGVCPENFKSACLINPHVDVAFLVLTSGSTGLPKVIQLSHAAVLNGLYTWWANPCNHAPLESSSILFSLSPLRWISQVEILLQSIILGIRRICANKANAVGSYGLQILQHTKPTHIFSVPSFFYDILLELPADDQKSLSSLKYIQLGGEHPSKRIMEMTRRHAINAKLFYSYGMSEVSGSVTNDEYLSGGKLQPGYEVQILDDELNTLGPNENGRLALKTPYPFLGYRGTDNTKFFLANGFFLNGDYGYFDDDNNLHLLARYEDLVRAPGAVLIPNTVESLALEVPELELARLVSFRQHLQNEGGETVCLFVVPKPTMTIDQSAISERLRTIFKSNLPSIALSQIGHIKFVQQLPTTTCGKIDRIKLKRWAQVMCCAK